MRKVIVDYPVVGWASTVIEVEDDVTDDDVLEMIENDDIGVEYNQDKIMSISPVLSLAEYIRAGGDGEAPLTVVIN